MGRGQMLAALSIPAVIAGVASSGLAATIVGLAVGGVLSVVGVGNGANIGLILGVVSGLFAGGWVAGRLAIHSERFHGAISGLLFGGILILLASLSSTSASIFNVLVLALVSILFGGFGGVVGGRRSPAET